MRMRPGRFRRTHLRRRNGALGADGSLVHCSLTAPLPAATDAGYRQVSLTVHPQNPAIRMHEACGFRKAGLRNTFHLMVAPLGTAPADIQ